MAGDASVDKPTLHSHRKRTDNFKSGRRCFGQASIHTDYRLNRTEAATASAAPPLDVRRKENIAHLKHSPNLK